MTITQRRRTLVTGGLPDELVLVPVDEAFVRYLDPETGLAVDPDPDADHPDEDLDEVESDFLPAPEIEAVAAALIAEFPEFEALRRARIIYRWRRKGGRVNGRAKLGACVRLTGLARDELGAQLLIWAAADYLRGAEWTRWQLEALIYHELCHAGRTGLHPHEFEGFTGELRRYGPWRWDLERVVATVQQPTLFELGAVR